jgi:hypothetical protein
MLAAASWLNILAAVAMQNNHLFLSLTRSKRQGKA